MSLRVVVADDSALLRRGLALLLAEAGVEVVGQASDADATALQVAATRPDVLIVDVRMPPTFTDEGLRVAGRVRREHPGTGVLVLSQFVSEASAVDVLGDDARGIGYLLKDRVADVGGFVDAVRRVAAGGTAFDPEVVARLVGLGRDRRGLGDLTAREREVLGLVAEGRSNAAISERLVVSPRTVEKHISTIFAKLGLADSPDDHRRVLAVVAYLSR